MEGRCFAPHKLNHETSSPQNGGGTSFGNHVTLDIGPVWHESTLDMSSPNSCKLWGLCPDKVPGIAGALRIAHILSVPGLSVRSLTHVNVTNWGFIAVPCLCTAGLRISRNHETQTPKIQETRTQKHDSEDTKAKLRKQHGTGRDGRVGTVG